MSFTELPVQKLSTDEKDTLRNTHKSIFLFCNQGHADRAEFVGIHNEWAVLMHCMECNERWYFCSICKNARSKLTTWRQIQTHEKSLHHKASVSDKIESKKVAQPSSPKPNMAEGPAVNKDDGPATKRAKTTNQGLVLRGCGVVKGHDSQGQKVVTEVLEFDVVGEKTADAIMDSIEAVHNSLDEVVEDAITPQGTTETALVVPNTHRPSTESVMVSDDTVATMLKKDFLYGDTANNIKVLPSTSFPRETVGFSDIKSQRYFQYCRLHYGPENAYNLGMIYLVTQAILKKTVAPKQLDSIEIPRDFALLHMKQAYHCFLITSSERGLFAQILSSVTARGYADGWHDAWSDNIDNLQGSCYNELRRVAAEKKDSPPRKELRKGTHVFSNTIPQTDLDVRRLYLQNQPSIVENLPYPTVKTDIPEHAYISIIDAIRDCFGHCRAKIQLIDPDALKQLHASPDPHVYHLSQSRRALDISHRAAEHPLKVGMGTSYIILWGDDCDTNQHGGANVWVKTVTIATPLCHSNCLENTYPIAIGPKGMSHNAIEKKINEDLAKLQSPDLEPFYVGAHNVFVQMYFEVMAVLGDQPEKRGSNYFPLGNSTYGPRSFVSANHKAMLPKLRACPKCVRTMKDRWKEKQWSLPLPRCQDCLNWDVLCEWNDLALTEPVPHYPFPGQTRGNKNPVPLEFTLADRVDERGGIFYVRPFQVTYETLKHAIDIAHRGLVDGNWTQDNFKAYVGNECLNDAASKKIKQHAVRAKALKNAKEGKPTQEVADEILEEARKNPVLFEKWPYPATFTRPNVEHYLNVEAVMHLGPEGIVKATLHEIQDVLKRRNMNTEFIADSKAFLKSLKKMGLRWLKVKENYGGKFNGWLSENYNGLCHVMPWFFQNIEKYNKKDNRANRTLPPENQMDRWKRDDLLHWLRIRGQELPKKKTRVDALQRVEDCLKMNPVPEILPDISVTTKEIENMIMGVVEVMRCMMSPVVNKSIEAETEYAVRLFCSAFDTLNAKILKKDKTPGILSKYNFACLMNLPLMMRQFGPLRHLFEGKFQGEAFLTFVKSWHTQGIRVNWQKNLLKNLLRDRCFKNVLPRVHDGTPDGVPLYDQDALKHRRDNFCVYSCPREVSDLLAATINTKKLPLSVILLTDKTHGSTSRIFSVVRESDYQSLVELTMCRSAEVSVLKFGLHYFQFRVTDPEKIWNFQTEVAKLDSPQIGYAVLLPLITDDDETETSLRFTMIGENWKRLLPLNSIEDLVD